MLCCVNISSQIAFLFRFYQVNKLLNQYVIEKRESRLWIHNGALSLNRYEQVLSSTKFGLSTFTD
ncbi:hypothetical protein GCHA_0921 [Paraglaciecola chathamensis S18K6]|uniref:Uncharacterized protein n=1 Tax=Paraglaciecola chathamensis S18K6 TaxID=1127672 RepID=A0AAV3UUR1_9ALTE|nr:hypothetical protein GCHA_0921 [Paraglaciecola chathamensis S18K6]